ncbi:early nodulin-like protein 9 [Arachis stenosperma]|uniref:early nodulin-like protein 9 n=1 Tax=Arachis stenosperma TaxID=217475 RepID=UPI0025AC25C3|nr:early nodulin-like protein 9 [Arachis stenosperma]
MEFVRPLPLLLILLSVLSTTRAVKFNVGGSAGWVPNPSQSYNQWAGSNRFQINDTLVFKYKKGSDSVLEVKKEDYDKCNKSNPIKKFDDGNTEFTLDHSGPFYFISGQDQNCQNKGQKLIVVVLAPRGTTPTPPSPKSPSPTPTPTPTPAPAPSGSPPVPAPTPAPAGNPPAPSVSPPTPTPATSPAPAGNSPSPSPVSGPPAPTPAGTTPSPSSGSPGPTTSPPVPPPATPPGGAAPGTANPPASSETAPPPGKNNAWAATPSKFLVYSATIVVAAVFFV